MAATTLATVARGGDPGGAAWASEGSDHQRRAGAGGRDGPATDRAFLAAVAHELKAPLASLSVASEVLAEDAGQLGPPQIRRMARTIHGSALWLLAAVENLLCNASIEAGRFEVHPRAVSLADIVDDILPVVEPVLGRRDQRLRLSLRGRGSYPCVLADRRRVGQVLVNLIANAGKYGPTATPIDLIVDGRDDRVRVTVADRGPGLPSKEPGRLFEPFFRGADACRSGNEGAGLGLAIAKAIVDAHGGRIGAEDRAQGGARFWIELAPSPADGRPGAPGLIDRTPRRRARRIRER
jgi:two-component system sensor histidine kinase KdpD